MAPQKETPAEHGQLLKYTYVANQEEVRVIQESRKERFYFKSAVTAGFGTLAFVAVKLGFLKRGIKGGPWPHIIWVSTAGYYVGKYSHMSLSQKMGEELMSIPNSLLGEAIRIEKERKKKGKKPTPEEVELRNEWRKETLQKRCLPIGTGCGLLAYLFVKSGYMRGNTRWGPWPKVLIGIVAGVCIGLDSNFGNLGLKLMSLPTHPLAEAFIRQQRHNNNNHKVVGSTSGAQVAASPPTVSQIMDSNTDGYFQMSGIDFISDLDLPPKLQIQRLENYKKLLLGSPPSQEQTEPLSECDEQKKNPVDTTLLKE